MLTEHIWTLVAILPTGRRLSKAVLRPKQVEEGHFVDEYMFFLTNFAFCNVTRADAYLPKEGPMP